MDIFRKNNYALISWLIALLAMSGSLYFSEILHLPPCLLCWYQRIVMYPLTVIIGVGILRKDTGLPLYVLPFSLIGLGISTFHSLLYYNLLPQSAAFCQAGISCTIQRVEFFGFATIPFFSAVAFLIITLCMLKYRRSA